ncbi:hypothetical protein F443_06313 [Phytophthora nicotianae P1569]|uniref:Uncharacterized protein n=1 Tax=Phytophthora nicotianae P1569 TaxID=1317065 RepID=V9FH06_PHYNI|nr:hypothetical protein F443_06313 [Phytophthora nicotianae P1569]
MNSSVSMKLHTTTMDSQQKLTPTPSDDGIFSKFRLSCCTAKSFKRVGVLLAFHLLNAFVAISGVISVAMLLASMVLMPLWAVALLLMALAMFMIHVVHQIPQKCLMYFGYVVLVALYIASLSIYWYITVSPYALFAAGAVGVGLFFLSSATMRLLVKLDVQLANFISTDKDVTLQPDDCAYRFKLSKATNPSALLPHIRMTRQVWLAVMYFASLKIAAGVLSTAVIVLTVVLPMLALFSGLLFGSQVTVGDNPIAYIGLIIAIWLIGAIGVPIVAVLSVRLTTRVCGAEQNEEEVEIEAAFPLTPEPESSTTSFAGLAGTNPSAVG